MGSLDMIAISRQTSVAQQSEGVGVLLTAGHRPVGDVPAGGIVVVGVQTHCSV